MPYGDAKCYFDGSHYIAIPQSTGIKKRGMERPEREIEVPLEESEEKKTVETVKTSDTETAIEEKDESNPVKKEDKPKQVKKVSLKDYFEELYDKNRELKKGKLRNAIINAMRPYFNDEEETIEYVDKNLDRKRRNLMMRRIRLMRKVNMQDFNYFCTFTYDSKKLTEETFKKRLKRCLSNFCFRDGWKYVGVWERSPEQKRLHFHGIFYIPKGKEKGELEERKDFDTRAKRMRITHVNTFFEKRFGRNDFDEITPDNSVRSAVKYIIKYIEKTGEKIVYSRGLPQFFISDIMDDDIVCEIDNPDFYSKKLLLTDNFNCWDEGCLIGRVSPEVIAQLRKVN